MSIAMIPIKMGRFHILEMNKPYGSEIKYGIRSSMQKRKKDGVTIVTPPKSDGFY